MSSFFVSNVLLLIQWVTLSILQFASPIESEGLSWVLAQSAALTIACVGNYAFYKLFIGERAYNNTITDKSITAITQVMSAIENVNKKLEQLSIKEKETHTLFIEMFNKLTK